MRRGAGHAGDCDGDARRRWRQRRKDHPRIVWIEKMVTKQETIQLYSHARVFCCPSVYEPFGIINLEAMACRAPVVASATGGIKEVVVDGEDRIPGAVRSGSGDEFSAGSGEICEGSGGADQRYCCRIRRSAGDLAMRAGGGWKRYSVGRRLRIRRSTCTRGLIEQKKAK